MKDEDSDSDEEVGCPFCGESGGCDHLLLYYDVSFREAHGGPVRLHEFDEIITTAMRAAISAGKGRQWLATWTKEFYDPTDESAVAAFVATPDRGFPSCLATSFIFGLLTEAGGLEIDGRLYDESGPSCESSVRVVYADDPNKTFEAAKALLTERLAKEIASRPEKGKRKKRGS